MDSQVSRIDRYRALLRQPLPTPARQTLEWLLVDAVRVAAAADRGRPWDRYPAPQVVAIADQAVTKAARMMRSQFANMQLYIATRDTLLMLAQRNFDAHFIAHFAAFSPDGRSGCSRAIASGARVILADIEQDEPFAPHVPASRAAGFRALQSTPLKLASGEPIGVITTHYAAPRAFSNDELVAMDAYARRVSAALERACA